MTNTNELWEEKNLIEPLMNCENNQTIVPNDIINDTKEKFLLPECKDIGNHHKRNCPTCKREMLYKTEISMTRAEQMGTECQNCNNKRKARSGCYKRNCPRCHGEIVYKSKRGYFNSKRYNSMCRSCTRIDRRLTYPSRKGCHLTEEHKEKIGRVVKFRHKMYGHPMEGKCHSPETIEKLKISNAGSNNGMYGKHHTYKSRKQISVKRIGIPHPPVSNDTRRKLRISRIKQISKLKYNGHPIIPSFNNTACIFFDEINKKFNLNGVYATNNGEHHIKELGYFLDYYEPTMNMVIEWDEPHHYYCGGKLTPKDRLRQDEIKHHLKCKFIRIKENKLDKTKVFDKIYEYIKNKS